MRRFDGAAAWDGLAAEQQAEIGALALELVMALAVEEAFQDCTAGSPAWAYLRAAEWGSGALMDRLTAAASRAAGIAADPETVAVPVSLGRVCRLCGCSDGDPCLVGCGWASDDLCSACAALTEAETSDGPRG